MHYIQVLTCGPSPPGRAKSKSCIVENSYIGGTQLGKQRQTGRRTNSTEGRSLRSAGSGGMREAITIRPPWAAVLEPPCRRRRLLDSSSSGSKRALGWIRARRRARWNFFAFLLDPDGDSRPGSGRAAGGRPVSPALPAQLYIMESRRVTQSHAKVTLKSR